MLLSFERARIFYVCELLSWNILYLGGSAVGGQRGAVAGERLDIPAGVSAYRQGRS